MWTNLARALFAAGGCGVVAVFSWDAVADRIDRLTGRHRQPADDQVMADAVRQVGAGRWGA